MDPFERPPLAPLVLEEIRQSIYQIDQKYWPLIIAFRIPNFIPPSIPVPPQRPHQLLELFKSYAKELYEAEASRYEPFRADPLYVTWLSSLNNRTAVHLEKVFRQLNEIDPAAMLLSHGIMYQRIDADVRELMFELGRRYSQPRRAQPPVSELPAQPEANNRKRIGEFILKMGATGLKVKRKDIWQAAGYKDRTEFERFQRGDSRNRSACSNFNRILNLNPDDFRSLMGRKP